MTYLYECKVTVFNGRYESKELTRVKASEWSAAVRKAIVSVLALRKKRGLSMRMVEGVTVQAIRIPSGRAS